MGRRMESGIGCWMTRDLGAAIQSCPVCHFPPAALPFFWLACLERLDDSKPLPRGLQEEKK